VLRAVVAWLPTITLTSGFRMKVLFRQCWRRRSAQASPCTDGALLRSDTWSVRLSTLRRVWKYKEVCANELRDTETKLNISINIKSKGAIAEGIVLCSCFCYMGAPWLELRHTFISQRPLPYLSRWRVRDGVTATRFFKCVRCAWRRKPRAPTQ